MLQVYNDHEKLFFKLYNVKLNKIIEFRCNPQEKNVKEHHYPLSTVSDFSKHKYITIRMRNFFIQAKIHVAMHDHVYNSYSMIYSVGNIQKYVKLTCAKIYRYVRVLVRVCIRLFSPFMHFLT